MSVLDDTTEIALIRADFARQLGEALGLLGLPKIPNTPRGDTLFVRPPIDRDYLDTTTVPATFVRPMLNLDVVVVAPSADAENTQDWIDRKVGALRRWLSIPGLTVAGHPRPRLMSVGAPGLLDSGSQLVAFELRFTGIQLQAVSA